MPLRLAIAAVGGVVIVIGILLWIYYATSGLFFLYFAVVPLTFAIAAFMLRWKMYGFGNHSPHWGT